MSNNKQNSEEQNHGYICPVTKVQCDDECCVSAVDCHIKSGYGILSSNNKQSSVEWLYFALEGFIHKSARVHFAGYFEQAKAMHKEEIKNAFTNGFISHLGSNRIADENFYNETYVDKNN